MYFKGNLKFTFLSNIDEGTVRPNNSHPRTKEYFIWSITYSLNFFVRKCVSFLVKDH